MALNISIAGSVFNSNGVAIDANIQVFAYNKNNSLSKWSDIRTTEDKDYNINLGDPDLSSQDNTLGISDSSNEFALIAVWTNEQPDRLSPASEFAFIVHELSGQEVYIQNIQLGTPEAITCDNWSLPTEVSTGDNIIGINNNTNELTYEAYSCTHYLYKKHFDINETVFGYMGACSQEFDFGLGYSTSNVYTPSAGGDLPVSIRISDCFGNAVECSKIVKVFYNIEPCFNHLPISITTGDEIFLTSCVVGDLEQIQEVKYTVNGEEIIGVDVSKIIQNYGNITAQQCVTYFDGYINQEKCISKTIGMDNVPPEIDLMVSEDPDNNISTLDYNFTHNGTDTDGTIEQVKWEIWRNNPDSNGNDNWNLYYSTGPITDLSDWQYDFTDLLGEFKVRATVYDNLGASATQEHLLAEVGCPEIDLNDILCFENVDWNKKIEVIDFSLVNRSTNWEIQTTKMPWEVKVVKILWDMKPKKIQFNPTIKKILFTYKLTDIGRPGAL